MLVGLADVMRPSPLLGKRHMGVVVDNVDDSGLGRIKVKVPFILETEDPERLPWIYPWRGQGGGANPANGTHNVPEIHTQVYVVFPDGNPYTAYYEADPVTHESVQTVATSNPVPEAPADELPTANTDPSDSSNLFVHGWQSTRGDPSWIRIDKAQNKVELYLGEPKLLFQFDRGGNIQLKTPGNVDIEIGGKLSIKVGGNAAIEVGGSATAEVTGDATLRFVASLLLDVAKDLVQKVSGDRSAIIGQDDNLSITGSQLTDIHTDQTTTVAGARSLTVTGADTETLQGGRTTNVTGDDSTTVSGGSTTNAATIDQTASGALTQSGNPISQN